MKPNSRAWKTLVAAAAWAALCLPAARAESPTAPAAASHTRALWACTESLYNRAEIERLVATAAAYDFEAIYVQVRRAGDAYYASGREPRSRKLENQPADFDPLAEVISLARPFGIRIHAWLNVNYVWPGPETPASANHVARAHTEWISVGRDGRRMTAYDKPELAKADAEGWYIDPGEKAFAPYFAEVAAEVARTYDVAGVHLDFIRYPNYRFGYSEKMRRAYREERGGADPILLGYHKTDAGVFRPAIGADGLAARWFDLQTLHWLDWRAAQVTRIVSVAHDAVKAAKPDAEFSAAVWANPEHAYRYVGQDWVTWFRRGMVDAIIPMTYWGDAGKLATLAARLDDCRPPGSKVYLGVGTFNHAEPYSASIITGLADAPADGVVLFDYDSCWRKPGVLPSIAENCPRDRGPRP